MKAKLASALESTSRINTQLMARMDEKERALVERVKDLEQARTELEAKKVLLVSSITFMLQSLLLIVFSPEAPNERLHSPLSPLRLSASDWKLLWVNSRRERRSDSRH